MNAVAAAMTGARRNKGTAERPARRVSPLTLRILAVNVLALAIVVVGMLYLDTYRDGLIDSKAAALRTQGELIGAALGESVVTIAADGSHYIDAAAARQLLRRLVAPIQTRARLFDAQGGLVGDTSRLPGAGGLVEAEALPPPGSDLERWSETVYGWVVDWLPSSESLEIYVEAVDQRAGDYHEAVLALGGVSASTLRDHDGHIVLSVAVPVQRFKQVQGALMLSTGIADVEASVRDVRYAILQLFAIGLAITITLSVFLSGTIVRPIRRLAEAADRVRRGHGRITAIPDFSARGDEIGDLSRALLGMNRALADRMVAIERFAADVAHEIKNPLTSLRSAVETAARIEDPEQQRKLLTIVREDVQRLDRLISDISEASRLDAELARAETEPVDIGRMLAVLAEVGSATRAEGDPVIDFTAEPDAALVVPGIEHRLVQVFQNMIANARSFSPPGATIRLAVRRDGDVVEASVEDEGPGIPGAKFEAIFDRFYSERPVAEKFGTHSGLGLSISKQIVEALGGSIRAENLGDAGNPAGARFVVRLPV